jgi:hypothetical protein
MMNGSQIGLSAGGSYSVMSAETGSQKTPSDGMLERSGFPPDGKGASKVGRRAAHLPLLVPHSTPAVTGSPQRANDRACLLQQ